VHGSQFGLKGLLITVSLCAVAAGMFRWLKADMATAILIGMAAMWPMLRYGDWAFFLKMFVSTMITLLVLMLGCEVVREMAEP
jgi:hypothetical protein